MLTLAFAFNPFRGGMGGWGVDGTQKSKKKPKLNQLFYFFFLVSFLVTDALCHARQTQTWRGGGGG